MRIVIGLIWAAMWVGVAQAELLTSDVELASSFLVVDFSQFSGLSKFWSDPSLTRPVQIGDLIGHDITWASSNESFQGGALIGGSDYGLGLNGHWNGRSGFTGVNAPSESMVYEFHDGPVAQVGVFMNYAISAAGNDPDVIIRVLAQDGSVLESYNISQLAPISTPTTDGMPPKLNAGAFRGIRRPNADIFGFEVANASVVVDDLSFSSLAVPEPASWVLFILGYGVAWLALRRPKSFRVASC